jgi:hypothetical protein
MVSARRSELEEKLIILIEEYGDLHYESGMLDGQYGGTGKEIDDKLMQIRKTIRKLIGGKTEDWDFM